jgi:hypothetical protein
VTESEWLACTDSQKMLEFLRGKASDRKLRLYACACCRHVWDLLLDERSRTAIEVAEQYADGQISDEPLAIIRNGARLARRSVKRTTRLTGFSPPCDAARAAETVVSTSVEEAVSAVGWVASAVGHQAMPDTTNSDFDDAYEAIWHFKMFHVCPLLRDLFGNPFRPVAINPAWQTPTVVSLAQAAYDERHLPAGTLDKGRLAVLADALEEAGCTDADILDHLRGPGPHVRGCWPVDLCLGKS